jgi:ribokinase
VNRELNKINITLLTSNVWADVFGNPVKDRDQALVTLIERYSPDVIMLQEVHPNWHRSAVLARGLEKNSYVLSLPDLNGNPLNYTPLAYRKDRFTEEKNLFLLYQGPNDYSSKSVSGALLRDKASGISFAAMSTHFYFAQNDEGNSARVSNARELLGCFSRLCEGGVPGFCGGDFNCDVDSEPFLVLNGANVRCASLLAENRINFVRTHHKNPTYDAETGKYIPAPPPKKNNRRSIDHIVVKGSAAVKEYQVISDEEALILSDHCPVLIRAEIGEKAPDDGRQRRREPEKGPGKAPKEEKTMKILNYGSLNIDHVYQMPAFVKAGETLSATDCQIHTGGKGLNQSVALARAGAGVFHGGKIGADGIDLKNFLENVGVNCKFLRIDPDVPTGHAIIQVVDSGENCILIYGGTNTRITTEEIDETLSAFGPGDMLLLQNEISNVNYLIHRAHEKGMTTVLNPSPITAELTAYDGLALLDWMIVNQGEAETLAGIAGDGKSGEKAEKKDPEEVIDALKAKYPNASIVMTLGKHGALCLADGKKTFCGTFDYGKRVDTTGAGDTFTGFFLAGLAEGLDIYDCMEQASKAAGLSVTVAGAANSIPDMEKVRTAVPINL